MYERFMYDYTLAHDCVLDIATNIRNHESKVHKGRQAVSLPADTTQLLEVMFPPAARLVTPGLVKGEEPAQRGLLRELLVRVSQNPSGSSTVGSNNKPSTTCKASSTHMCFDFEFHDHCN